MKISYTRAHETVAYAAEELKKYIEMMDSSAAVTVEEGDISSAKDCIKLGLLEDFSLSTEDLEDPFDCDIYDVKIAEGRGYIAGSNPRSILYGVYAFLKSAGCRWVRPGIEGEYIPQFDITNHSFEERKKAHYSTRGQTIEGAISYEHVRDAIIWMPKAGFNTFAFQFVYPYGFFKRWYNHVFNNHKSPEDVNYEEIEEIVHKLEALTRKCGLMKRNLGHGYLFEPYGIRYYGSVADTGIKYEIPEQYKKYAALVKGKRDVYGNSINFTQLCYSNPQVRKDCTEYIVNFVKERKPDILTISLADASDNYCECEECMKKMPADWHIMFVNEVDEALEKEGLDVRIGFGLYVNTLWPPKTEKFRRPEKIRLSIGFNRSFAKPLTVERNPVEIPEYKRNQFNVVLNNDLSRAFIDAWRPVYQGKFGTTSYDLYFSHFSDPGYSLLAKRTAEDLNVMPQIPEIGGMGCIMTQRFGMPTALPATIFGEFLFDPTLKYEEFADKYFADAFGEDSSKAKAYLEEISNLFDPKTLVVTGSIVKEDTGTGKQDNVAIGFVNNPEAQARYAKIPSFVDSFEPVIEEHLALKNPCHKKSWEILKYHAEYCRRFSKFYLALSKVEVEKAQQIFDDLIDWLFSVEDIIGPYFDVYLLKRRTDNLLNRFK